MEYDLTTVIGKPSYCKDCGQEQFPEDCCVCDGKNPELKHRLDAEMAVIVETLTKQENKSRIMDEEHAGRIGLRCALENEDGIPQCNDKNASFIFAGNRILSNGCIQWGSDKIVGWIVCPHLRVVVKSQKEEGR